MKSISHWGMHDMTTPHMLVDKLRHLIEELQSTSKWGKPKTEALEILSELEKLIDIK